MLPAWAQTALPLFLPERRVEEALRDGVRLPDSLTTPLTRAFRAACERADEEGAHGGDSARLVTPGSLGKWTATGSEAASG